MVTRPSVYSEQNFSSARFETATGSAFHIHRHQVLVEREEDPPAWATYPNQTSQEEQGKAGRLCRPISGPCHFLVVILL
jgi:hypothetical protein